MGPIARGKRRELPRGEDEEMEPLTLAEIAERTGADIVHRGPGFEDRAVRGVVATDLMSDALTCETDGVLMVTALASPQALRTADMIGAVGVLFTLGKALPRDIPAMAGQLGLTVLRTRLPKFETCAALLDRPGGAP
jgi:hypothetical protein